MPSQTGESGDEVSLPTLPKSPLLRRVVIVAAPRNFNNAATSSGVLRPSSENLVVGSRRSPTAESPLYARSEPDCVGRATSGHSQRVDRTFSRRCRESVDGRPGVGLLADAFST